MERRGKWIISVFHLWAHKVERVKEIYAVPALTKPVSNTEVFHTLALIHDTKSGTAIEAQEETEGFLFEILVIPGGLHA